MEQQQQFEAIAQAWTPLIRRGAKSYSIPGRMEVQDLMQEGFILLLETVRAGRTDPTTEDFQRYFKTAFFHRLMDTRRRQTSALRDYRKDRSVSESFFTETTVKGGDWASEVGASLAVEQFREGLTGVQRTVFDHLTKFDSEGEEKPPQRLSREADAAALGLTPSALKTELKRLKEALTEALTGVSSAVDLAPYFRALGFYIPQKSRFSCLPRVNGEALTYGHLTQLLTKEEKAIMDYLLQWPKKAWELSMISRRLGMTIHQVRRCMDSSREKLDALYQGVPLGRPNEDDESFRSC